MLGREARKLREEQSFSIQPKRTRRFVETSKCLCIAEEVTTTK
jgi:hypothetical protein